MLEKIFGKKSTGVVYIVCAGMLLVTLAVNILVSFNARQTNILSLLSTAIFIIFELVLISVPVFVQKKFKIYIPPSVEIGLCIYAVLYVADSTQKYAQATIAVSFVPFVGGFVVAMTVFSIVSALAAHRSRKKGKKTSAFAVSLATFFIANILILIANIFVYLIGGRLLSVASSNINDYLKLSIAHYGGNAVFCIIGGITAHSQRWDRYSIRSFKDVEKAKETALERNNRTQYAVIENISSDDTDYKKILQNFKAQYFFTRIVYIVLYAGYVLHTAVSLGKQGGMGIAVAISLCAGLVLTALLYVYEYYLFRHGSPNQRLRRLKIAKTSVRIYTLSFTVVSLFTADAAYNSLSSWFSFIMAIINLCVLFYNIFGKPRYYPSSKKSPKDAEETSGGAPAESTAKEQEQSAPHEQESKTL